MTYDAIIIGSGQAGNPLSHALADRGWTVALIEKEHLGGTCVNTGCTPTKTMVMCAQVAHYARNASNWGDYQIVYANLIDGNQLTTDNRPVPYALHVAQRRHLHSPDSGRRVLDVDGQCETGRLIGGLQCRNLVK